MCRVALLSRAMPLESCSNACLYQSEVLSLNMSSSDKTIRFAWEVRTHSQPPNRQTVTLKFVEVILPQCRRRKSSDLSIMFVCLIPLGPVANLEHHIGDEGFSDYFLDLARAE